jgi:hypothetical protein
MGDPVAALLDERAIRDVLASYCRGIDRIDHELARSVWHPDGTADYVGVFAGSGAAFVEFCLTAHMTFAAHSHQITNVLIALDGDLATSEAYVTARLRNAGAHESPTDLIVCGRYLDKWSRRDGRWAIDHRLFVTDISSTYPVAESVESAYRRDSDDPSYALFAGRT